MEQYIPKSAVLAEIDKVMAEEMKFYETACKEGDEEVSSSPMVYARLQILRSCFDTLEAKEVDLEKELIKWHKEHFKKDGTFIGMSGFYLTNNSQMDIAKHFLELGLKAQKGEKYVK